MDQREQELSEETHNCSIQVDQSRIRTTPPTIHRAASGRDSSKTTRGDYTCATAPRPARFFTIRSNYAGSRTVGPDTKHRGRTISQLVRPFTMAPYSELVHRNPPHITVPSSPAPHARRSIRRTFRSEDSRLSQCLQSSQLFNTWPCSHCDEYLLVPDLQHGAE